jgi:MFS family permease
MVISVQHLFSNPNIPQEHKQNFTHLYFDIAWFGILSGSAINFLNIYAVRLGASGVQIGLLGAIPALVSLALSIPSGRWVSRRPINKAVFWSAAFARLGYLLWIPLPWLFNHQGQIWALISITFLMGIPICALGVGFNALFAAAVPVEWRASVAGNRNIILSITYMAASLGSGYLLNHLPFPVGYQIIFAIGFIGSAMSTLHLFFIRLQSIDKTNGNFTSQPASQAAQEKIRRNWRDILRLDIWKTDYSKVMLVFFGFHLSQYLAIPLFPLYSVNVLRLTDINIGIGTAIFYLTVLIGSTQLHRFERKIGHHKITSWGVVTMCIYPIAMALSRNAFHYYLLSAMGGFAWAMVGGAYANYLLERIPANDRPPYLAWYNIVLNTSVLCGSIAGPILAGYTGISTALIIIGFLRFLSGVAMLKWG